MGQVGNTSTTGGPRGDLPPSPARMAGAAAERADAHPRAADQARAAQRRADVRAVPRDGQLRAARLRARLPQPPVHVPRARPRLPERADGVRPALVAGALGEEAASAQPREVPHVSHDGWSATSGTTPTPSSPPPTGSIPTTRSSGRWRSRARHLWERRASDSDFLELRLGRGRVDHARPVALEIGDDPLAERELDLEDEASSVRRRWERVNDVPVTVDLQGARVVSIVGAPDSGRALARSLVSQLAVFRTPDRRARPCLLRPGLGGELGVDEVAAACARRGHGPPGRARPAAAADPARLLRARARQAARGRDRPAASSSSSGSTRSSSGRSVRAWPARS